MDVADRAAGYGMPGVVVDGMDVIAVYEAGGEAIARARKGQGPTLLECKTYRFYDHVGVRGMGLSYRSDEELERWQERDPIGMFEKALIDRKILTEKEATNIKGKVQAEVDEGVTFAEDSPMPDPEELLDDVYAA